MMTDRRRSSEALPVNVAVEGDLDEVVARRLLEHAGGTPGRIFGKEGKSQLRQRIRGYNEAARRSPWLVVVDLDTEADCAPPLRQAWLRSVSRNLCFRVAVREIEAWLLADAAGIARFLSVSKSRIPLRPEALPDPKAELVRIARRSRKGAIQKTIVPRSTSGRKVGPEYTAQLSLFAQQSWDIQAACRHSDSLARAVRRIRELVSSRE